MILLLELGVRISRCRFYLLSQLIKLYWVIHPSTPTMAWDGRPTTVNKYVMEQWERKRGRVFHEQWGERCTRSKVLRSRLIWGSCAATPGHGVVWVHGPTIGRGLCRCHHQRPCNVHSMGCCLKSCWCPSTVLSWPCLLSALGEPAPPLIGLQCQQWCGCRRAGLAPSQLRENWHSQWHELREAGPTPSQGRTGEQASWHRHRRAGPAPYWGEGVAPMSPRLTSSPTTEA